MDYPIIYTCLTLLRIHQRFPEFSRSKQTPSSCAILQQFFFTVTVASTRILNKPEHPIIHNRSPTLRQIYISNNIFRLSTKTSQQKEFLEKYL